MKKIKQITYTPTAKVSIFRFNVYRKEWMMIIEIEYFWFRLFKTRGIGPKRLATIARILKAEELTPDILSLSQNELTSLSPELGKILNGKIHEEDREKVLVEYNELKNQGIDILYPGHPDFPSNLLDISPVMFIKGQRKHLISDRVAMVGARDASNKGIEIARKLAGDLAKEGLNVVSGYAKGIDSMAHLGALEVERTTTIVLPYGINELKQKNILKQFNWKRDVLVISQFDPSAKWFTPNVMLWNKLVCALSKAIIVIESGPEQDEQGKMSGTFNTAKTALDIGIDLFVIDPDCLDSHAKGNVSLIELGGHKIDPKNGVKEIVQCVFSNLI